jgi:alanyl-tRNA synthetase
LLKVSLDDVVPALERLFERQRDVEKEIASLRQSQLSTFAEQLHATGDADLLVARVDGYAGEQLRTLAQDLQRRGRRAVVLVGAHDDKVAIAVATDATLDAQKTVKELATLVGGGGGGSSTLALAGGRDPSGIDQVLRAGSAL